LRIAIDCLPAETRRAMLDGIRTNPIVVGAYTDNRGGICPMLAAHRNGGRTTFLQFARSWDAFSRSKRVRRATERELTILDELLESSLLSEEEAVDLGAAIAEHEAARRRREASDEVPEIVARRLKPAKPRPGDYERAYERLSDELARL
jgi:hypothetical protein